MTNMRWEPPPSPESSDGWREGLRLARYCVLRYPRSFLGVGAMVLVSTALILPAPLISKAIVNLVVQGGDVDRIVTLSMIALAAVVFERFVSYWHGVVIFHRFRCLAYDMRTQLLDHLLNIPLLTLQRKEAANLSSRIANDTQNALQAFYDDLISVSESAFTCLVCIVAMLWIEVRLGLLVVASVPVYVFLLQRFGVKIRKLTDAYYNENASNNALYYHLLAAPEISKIHSHDYIMGGYSRACQSAIKAAIAMMRMRAFSYAVVLLIGNALPVLILLFSALLILKGMFDLGSFVAFTAFMGYLFPALRRIVEYVVRAQGGAVALRRINELLSIPTENVAELGSAPMGDLLTLTDVVFAYEEGETTGRGALNNVNMSFVRGELVGVMGESGGGKTTLLKIISGLYSPISGEVALDGQAIPSGLRRKITSYVEQEPLLFADSLIENVRLGREEFSEQSARDILVAVGLEELLVEGDGKKGGSSPFVEQGGANLSLGQKKRLALARGLLKRSDIIVIDEPTAGLDAENANRAMQTIRKLCKDQFVIIVSHTRDVMDYCDRLFLVQGGQVQETTASKGPTAEAAP